MKKLLPLWMFLPIFLVLAACSDNSEDIDRYYATVSTPKVTTTTPTSLTVTASVTGDLNQIVKKGFCYSAAASVPTIKDHVVDADENFSASLSTLTSGTSYYIRAYVYCDSRYVYSEVVTATTESLSLDDELKNYVAPTYSDDYTSISDWSKRSQWNLANVHDPSVVLAEDGYYYMYQTDASYGNVHTAGGHFHGRRSKDLVNWEYLGGTMKNLPEWVVPKLNEIRKEMGLAEINPNVNDFGYWAPVVRKVKNGLYRMYYSIVCPGTLNGANTWSERAFIGLMENNDPSNNDGWVDKGYVITNASDKGLNFNVKPDDWANCYYKWNAIDPSYIITPENTHWLIYGSWHSGIVAMELNVETGMPKQDLGVPWAEGSAPAEYGQLIATRDINNRWQASEGPEIIYNAETGYYYLFVAYDALDIPYNTRVCRSKSITGPYIGIDGANVTEGAEMLPVVTHPYKFGKSNGWVGFSHCTIFNDGKGNWYYASQARLPKSVDNAIMLGHVRSIRWTKDGWPLVMPERYGAVPQVAITEEELIGNWEHIDLSYSYGVQKESATMTLAADHTITEGTWKGGTWSYDAEQQILTANGIDLYLQREVDWEASPRTPTIVYAAYGSNHKTYWGKKVK